ncbi:MAG: hypothetical protein U0163_05860 [Gemmatimonadaceae bacterium]
MGGGPVRMVVGIDMGHACGLVAGGIRWIVSGRAMVGHTAIAIGAQRFVKEASDV